ncbi:unnamed protein product [Diamesa serratosioi]
MDNPTENLNTTRTPLNRPDEECCEPSNETEQDNNIELSIPPLVPNPPNKEPRKRIRYFSGASEKNSQISEASTTTTSSNSINDNSIWFNYKLRTHEGEQRIYEQYRYYNEHPENHPKYTQEWKTFWKIRYTKESEEGEEPSYYQIKQEWINFWIVRLKYFEILEISEFRSTTWEHIRRENSSYTRKSSSNDSPRCELEEIRNKYEERNSYRFKRINESPPRRSRRERSYSYSTNKRDCYSQKDSYRERYSRQDRRSRSKERVDYRSRRAFDEHDEMDVTVVSCCCKILGIAEVSESIRSQITSLLVKALDYEKHGMHSTEFVMSKENMEFFKLVRNKIKESLDAGHIKSKKSYVIEELIENISILVDNKIDNWMSMDEHDPVLVSLSSKCISPIRALPDDGSKRVPKDLRMKIPIYRTIGPLEETEAMESSFNENTQFPVSEQSVETLKFKQPVNSLLETSEDPLKELPTSSRDDSSEDLGAQITIEDPLNIVRSSSNNSLLSSDSSIMPPGVSDYETEVLKPISLDSSQDSIDCVEIIESPVVSADEVDTPAKTIEIDKQQHEYIKDLTDDELKYLLKNFNQLTDEEQQCLIIFLEKIDHSGDENRMEELKNFMLSCEDDQQIETAGMNDENNNMKESREYDAEIEFTEQEGTTKETMNEAGFFKGPFKIKSLP